MNVAQAFTKGSILMHFVSVLLKKDNSPTGTALREPFTPVYHIA
jgi:hypothetical protein